MKIIVGILAILFLCVLVACVAVTRPSLPIKKQSLSKNTVSSEALRTHVKYLSETCVPRDYEQIKNLDMAASYIKNQLIKSADTVEFQTFTANNQNYKNVIGIYGPDTEEIYVVGAHYDAFLDLPGADDNASGIAGLLELGNLLSKLNLKTRILLAAYTLEEPPFFRSDEMGSAVHAKSLYDREIRIKLMISLEMIGYFSDEEGSQDFPIKLMGLLYPNKGNYIAVVDQMFANNAGKLKTSINTYTSVPAYSINAPRSIPGVDFSDHMYYWNYGYPAVMITDTAFYRNKNYHTPNDTYEKLNYEKMSEVVYGVFKFLEKNTT